MDILMARLTFGRESRILNISASRIIPCRVARDTRHRGMRTRQRKFCAGVLRMGERGRLETPHRVTYRAIVPVFRRKLSSVIVGVTLGTFGERKKVPGGK